MGEEKNKNIEKIKKNFTPKKIIAGIIAIIAVIAVMLFIDNDNTTVKIENYGLSKKNYAVKKSETNQINLVDYDGGNFTMKIPEGWQVTTAGTEMYYTIHVQDPKDERNQIFTVLKAGPFLKSNEAKQWQTWYVNTTGNQAYKMFSEAVILNPATTENFYENFNNYTDYIKTYEPTCSNFKFPFLSVFKKIEQFESNSSMKSVSLDDKTIRATFEDSNGKAGEGLFMSSIVDFGPIYAGRIDTSQYFVYNIIFITSAKDEFVNYESILTKSFSTLQYKDSFINVTNASGNERTKAALQANATVQSAYNSYNSAWSARQKTYDITSQKYSDATLGYERVYDTDTGEIYKAYNGFTDDYTGERYQVITDDMYTESVSGYIEKNN